MSNISLDEGYLFGLGVFETIGVEQARPIFLEEHLRRLFRGMEMLHIDNPGAARGLSREAVEEKLRGFRHPRGALKICVSENNLVISLRENTYTRAQYEQGFHTQLASIERNETSPFVYIKSLQYGENILEKRAAARRGCDEPIFLNRKGQLAEGATTNIFLCREGKLYTPPVSCGLLDGIMRQYIMSRYQVKEQVLYPEELQDYEEMFLSNSLLGVMPVNRLGSITFSARKWAREIGNRYFREILL